MSGFGRKTVLITFGRSYLSLHLARLMGAAGHDVLITDSVPFPSLGSPRRSERRFAHRGQGMNRSSGPRPSRASSARRAWTWS